MQIKKIILVFKTHIDIGFTGLSSEILAFYAKDMLDRVAETCNATCDMGMLRYVWTMPAWPLKIMREENENNERGKVLDNLVKRGQLTWHALPYTSHYDFCGVEDAVWGLQYSKKLSQHYRQNHRCAAKMTDVPGHGLFLPELLADAGINFIHMGCNEFAMPVDVPTIFWWEALSGKRVLTMYNSGYGTPLLPPENWPFTTWIALINTNDNSGPQSAESIQSAYSTIRTHFPNAEVSCGTLEDFWQAISSENLETLPVVRSDFADTWIHGIASYPRETAMIRRLRGRLLRVEEALSMNPKTPAEADIRTYIREARDAMALFGEHTWGLDVKTWLGSIPDYDNFDNYRQNSASCSRMEESWREQANRAETALKACTLAEEALNLEPPHSFRWEDGEKLEGEHSLCGKRYRLDFSADTGVIHQLFDLQLDCPLLSEKEGTGIFSYRYDRYGTDDLTEYLRSYAHRFSDWGLFDNGRINYPECSHIVRKPSFTECKRNGQTLQFTYTTNSSSQLGDAEIIILYITIPSNDKPVRVRVELKNKHATPYIESGTMCFPLFANAPKFYINKTGTIIRPEIDIAANANHAFYALEHFIASEDNHSLLGIISHDCPLVSIGENGIHKFRKFYEAHNSEIRFCLFNNMWGTNFPQWIEGNMSFEFDIIALQPGETNRMYVIASELANNPTGFSEPEIPFEISDYIRISNLSFDGNAILLRVQSCESCRRHGSIKRIGWHFEEVDLLGRSLNNEWDNTVDIEFLPFELRSFKVVECEKR